MKTISVFLEIGIISLTIYNLFKLKKMSERTSRMEAAMTQSLDLLNKIDSETTSLHENIKTLNEKIAQLELETISQEEIDTLTELSEKILKKAEYVDSLTEDAAQEAPESPEVEEEETPETDMPQEEEEEM